MLENIDHIKTNFEFHYIKRFQSKYEETLPMQIVKQVLLKRASFGQGSWPDGGYGYGYESYHLEFKIADDNEKEWRTSKAIFLDDNNNTLCTLRVEDVNNTSVYKKINLVNVPVLLLEDVAKINLI